MKKKTALIVPLIFIIIAIFAIPVGADMGPKPSVVVNFENMGDELCFGTLLSESEFFGPYSVWDGNEENIRNYDLDIEIWRKFAEYEDPDGFVFLQVGWKVSDTKSINWNYYPPSAFKILLYYPESDRFAVSGIYEEYAFHSYYTVNMNGIDIWSVEENAEKSSERMSEDDLYLGNKVEHTQQGSNQTAEESTAHNTQSNNQKFENNLEQDITQSVIQNNIESVKAQTLIATPSYDYTQEMLSLVVRIILTILIEMGIALLFSFKEKKQLVLLVAVNTSTQVILNVILNVVDYKFGYLAFIAYYIWLELAVFAIESMLYCILMEKISENRRKKRVYILYALIANAVSFVSGMFIAEILPGIF